MPVGCTGRFLRCPSRWIWRKFSHLVGAGVARWYLGDEKLAYLVATRYPTAGSFVADGVNQLAFALRRERVPMAPPTATIELTNACNLRCGMCPTVSSMKRARSFFPLPLYRQFLQVNPSLRRIVLTNWGEPLLHRNAVTFVDLATRRGLESSITTNGLLLDRELSKALLGAGLGVIRFSLDGLGETYRALRNSDYGQVKRAIEEFAACRQAGGYRTSIEISCVVCGQSDAELSALVNEWAGRADFINFQGELTYQGAGERTAPCRELYRSLVVLSNGDVVPCCADYDGALAIGNLNQEPSLTALSNSQRLKDLRRAHHSGRLPSFCRRCHEYPSTWAPKRF